MGLGDLRLRMERIAVAGQRADLQPTAGDRVLERLQGGLVAEQLGRLTVGISRIAAGADLDGGTASLLDVIECLLQGASREQHGEDSDLHVASLPRWAVRFDWRGILPQATED